MIGVFILTIGQETEKEAIASIKNQVDDVQIIRNVSPANKAENLGFKLAEEYNYDYFMFLGADTILKPNAIKVIMSYMTDELWCVMGRLEDYWRGTEDYANHLYSLKALKGYRVNETDLMYDHRIHWDMEKKGYKKVVTKEVIGKHHPVWTVREAFEKHLFSGKRYKEKDFKKYFDQVVKRYKENPCEVNRAAKIGFQLGIGANAEPLTNKETKEWKDNKKNFKINDKLVW